MHTELNFEKDLKNCDKLLSELDKKLKDCESKISNLIENFSYEKVLLEEQKKKGIEIAKVATSTVFEYYSKRKDKESNKKIDKAVTVTGGLVILGSLVFSGISSIKEKRMITQRIKEFKEIFEERKKSIIVFRENIPLVLQELKDIQEKKIKPIIANLSKYSLEGQKKLML